jgi:uncharacterized RDD family membrane protein YckC
MVYEAMLLFGIFFSADLLFDLLTQSHDPLTLRNWRQLYLFIVLGWYFTYFWRRNGQTLPMQTWHIKVVDANLQPITFKQACLRYCIAWMWFLPALGLNDLFQLQHGYAIALFFIGMGGWAITSRLDKSGQFLHDKLAGTQLIMVPKIEH